MKKLKQQQQQMVSGGGMKILKSNNQEELIMGNLNKTMVKTNQEGFKMIQSIFTIFILTLMVNFTGCMIGDNDINVLGEGTKTTGNGNDFRNHIPVGNKVIDYKSYSGAEHSVIVDNNTNYDLICYFGAPSENRIISGVPCNKSNHGLKKIDIFSESTDFVLNCVKSSDYLQYRNNLEELDNRVLTKVYAYYNTNSDNNNFKVEISERLGGDCSIVLNNMTNYNCELRNNGIYGETIGFAGAYTLKTTFSVESNDYIVFPIFRRFDKNSGEIISAYARYENGQIVRKRFSLTDSFPTAELNSSEWISKVKFCNTASYIYIINNSTSAISFYNSSNGAALSTSTGKKLINSGSSMLFELSMLLIGDGEYSEYISSSTLAVGAPDIEKTYITSGNSSNLVNFNYYAGKVYTVNVYGDDLQLNIDLTWKDHSTDCNF